MQLDWSKTAKHFSINSYGKFLSWHKAEARRQASKWISPLRQILFILLVSYFSDACCIFHLQKMLIRILSIIFNIYCSFPPQLLSITLRPSDGMFLSFAAIAFFHTQPHKIVFSKRMTALQTSRIEYINAK